MTRERIEDIREIVMPFVSRRLKEINYENLGESDAKEFERDFNEILNLAIKALEPVEPIGNSDKLGTPKKNLEVAEQELCEDCISRDAVHEMLENILINPNDKWFNWLQKACLRLAELPSVKQEPKTEPCDDCVSRKDIYFKLTNGAYSNETIEQYIDRLVEELKALPSVNPQEPRKGHWIERIERDEYNDYEEEWFECDQCHIDAERPCNYCPNCGCRMEK